VSAIPILVTGAVALGVPVVAALWARSNQARQLEHDRQIRDLEELRRLLDAAAELLSEALVAEARVRGARIWDRSLETSDEGQLAKSAVENQRALVNARVDLHLRASAMDDRITMRLRRDAPVAVLYRAAVAVLNNMAGVTDHEEEPERWKTLNRGLGEARKLFVDEATKLIGSRLPPSPKTG
jgi:hypothetical protein